MGKFDKDIKRIVGERLLATPPNISFSIGNYGDFTRDQLIEEVDKESLVGEAVIEMQVEFIRRMPKLLAKHSAIA